MCLWVSATVSVQHVTYWSCGSRESRTSLTHLLHWEGRASQGLEEQRGKPSVLPGLVGVWVGWVGGPCTAQTAPSKGFVTLLVVSLPCLGLYGQRGSGWPSGSSEHLPGAFQQHKEQRLSGQGSWKGGAVVVKRGRASGGSTQPQFIYSPKRRQGGMGWVGGWIGMPAEDRKKHILQLQHLWGVNTVDVCVSSHRTGVQWTCFNVTGTGNGDTQVFHKRNLALTAQWVCAALTLQQC